MTQDPLLDISKVELAYGSAVAVHDAAVSVFRGSITGLIGPNGGGKTSLLKAVVGLVKPRRGRIVLNGSRIEGRPAQEIAALRVAYIPEGRGLLTKMSVLDNLRLGAYLRHDRHEVRRSLEGVFEMFPRLRERRWQQAGSLSGGEQQMVAIGRALVSMPQLIIADEMSQGLAPNLVQEVYERLIQVSRERGLTVLLAEQNARLAFRWAEQIYVMEQGRVLMSGRSHDLASSDYVVKAYLGSHGRRPHRQPDNMGIH